MRLEIALTGDAPGQSLPGMERYERNLPIDHLRRHFLHYALKRYPLFVKRQAVKPRAVFRRKALQPVKSAFLVEHRSIAFDGIGGVENAGAAAAGLLGVDFVWRAVGAKKELGRA